MEEVSSRIVWADAAKGVVIVCVVFIHVLIKHFLYTDWDINATGEKILHAVYSGLTPIRMPLFFTLSGLFAANAIHRPWPSVLQKKMWFFYYLYLLWLLIQTAVYQFAPHALTDVAHSPLKLLAQATVDPSTLWYFYALAIYFPLAKLLSIAQRTSVLVFAAISILSTAGMFGRSDLTSVIQNIVWFLFGAYCARRIFSWANSSRLWWLAILIPAFLAPLAIKRLAPWLEAPLFLVSSILGIALGLCGAVQLERHWKRAARAISFIGRRTLPIYVIHLPLIVLWDEISSQLEIGNMMSSLALTIIYPVVLTAVIVAASLGLYALIVRPLPLLFRPPSFRRATRAGGASAKDISNLEGLTTIDE